jgi:hypothetical protein
METSKQKSKRWGIKKHLVNLFRHSSRNRGPSSIDNELIPEPQNRDILRQNAVPLKSKLETPPQFDTKRGSILTKIEIDSIHESLPLRFRNIPWHLLYSTREHGISLQTLYVNCFEQGPCLVVIKTEDFETIGAFSPESFLINQRKYYGSGESFIFSFKNDQYKTYKWTKANENFIFSSKNYLSFGAPKPAICINEDLLHGSSYASDTYGNQQHLTSRQDFDCYVVEVWGLEKKLNIERETRSHSLDIPRGLSQTESRERVQSTDVRGTQTRASLDFFR